MRIVIRAALMICIGYGFAQAWAPVLAQEAQPDLKKLEKRLLELAHVWVFVS